MDLTTDRGVVKVMLMEQIKLLNKQITEVDYGPETLRILIEAQLKMIDSYHTIIGF